MESRLTRATLLALLALAGAGAARPAAAEASAVQTAHGALAPQERLLWNNLAARLTTAIEALDGVAGLTVHDLRSGATLQHNAGGVFPTASVIKLAVLYELYRQADSGRIKLSEVTRPPLPRVGGGGALELLSGDVSLTWRDLAVLMMAFSDNAATNVLIERLGLTSIDARLRELGLGSTRLRRRMLDLEAARRGDENVSSAGDLQQLVLRLRDGTGLRPESARDLLSVAGVAKASPLREGLPEGVTVIDKPGDLEGVRAVAALVELPERPYVVTVLTGWLRHDGDGDAFIREVSRAVFETCDRLARASEFGRRLR